MKRLKKFLFLLLLLPICANAQVAMNDASVEEVDGSNVITGNNVTSTNKINGINIVFGNNINLNGENDYAILFGNNVNVSGIVNNDGFIFGNIINFSEDAVLNRDLVIFGNEVVLDGKINRDVTVFAYSVTINGEISGSVDVKASILKVNDSIIQGQLSYNEDIDATISDNAQIGEIIKTETLTKEVSVAERVVDFVIDLGGTLIIFLAFYLVVPKLFKRMENKNADISVIRILSMFGFGALALIMIPIIFFVLFSLVIGVPLAFLLLILYIIAIWLSNIFSSYLLGYVLWNKVWKKESNPLLIGLIGIVLLKVLMIIPVIGLFIGLLSLMIGLGIILQQFKKD